MKGSVLTAGGTRRPSIAARLAGSLCERIEHERLRIELPGGDHVEGGGSGNTAIWRIHDWRAVPALLARGATGFAEAYLRGYWDSPDLTRLLRVACVNEAALGAAVTGLPGARLLDGLRHRLRANTRRQARRNISFHYDLGNEFYAEWLDSSMTYSSAVFSHDDEPLEQAQDNKYARLAGLLGPCDGDRVLEIGCGWGGFMEHLTASRDVRVTGVSISREQCDFARQRLVRAGLDTHADVRFRDYRDLDGTYDRIVSIEMFEAVGEAYWDVYAGKLKSLLAPGGRAALQVITIDEQRFEGYRREPDFIQRYIFPGGMLPSKTALEGVLAAHGLKVVDRASFGTDYARTLVHWRERFEQAWPRISRLGFDDRFRRLWRYYLSYCEAGFMERATDVVQLGLEHA